MRRPETFRNGPKNEKLIIPTVSNDACHEHICLRPLKKGFHNFANAAIRIHLPKCHLMAAYSSHPFPMPDAAENEVFKNLI